jgi:uncharacterized OB-fold protein
MPLAPPVPKLTEENRFYWEAARERRLELLCCNECGHFVHYPRPICDKCQSMDLAPKAISGRGQLYSFTTVMQAGHPYFADKIPYVIGVIEIEEEAGVHVPAGIVDATEEDLRCGMAMEVTFQDLDPVWTLPYFRPANGNR